MGMLAKEGQEGVTMAIKGNKKQRKREKNKVQDKITRSNNGKSKENKGKARENRGKGRKRTGKKGKKERENKEYRGYNKIQERGKKIDGTRERREVAEHLGSQFFIASNDLPSQEYFLALQRRSRLRTILRDLPCI